MRESYGNVYLRPMKHWILFLALGFPWMAWGAVGTDSLSLQTNVAPVKAAFEAQRTPFKARSLVLPAALVGVGALGIHPPWGSRAKEDAHTWWASSSVGKSNRVADAAQFLPYAASVGLGELGVKARHGLRDRALVTATTFVLAEGFSRGLKGFGWEQRPDGTDRHSFPSGHSTRAFAGAELVRVEYGAAWGTAAYAAATGIALWRVRDNRHWWNDVVAGAGVGILSARLSYLLLPFEQRLLGLSPTSEVQVAVLPTYDPQYRSTGLGLVVLF